MDVREQILKTVQVTFSLVRREAELLYEEMKLCLKRRELVSIGIVAIYLEYL